MATIISSGIGSGLDINGLVTQLLDLERKPLTALAQKEAVYQAELSAYGNLRSAISTFQTTVRSLAGTSRFQALKTTVGDTTLIGAAASASAVPGSHSVEVQQLAQGPKLVSKAFNTATDAVGTGTITIQFGSWSGTSFTANAAKPARTVTVDSAHGSLGGVRDAINAAGVGVRATLLNDGTGQKLVLTGEDTGAVNSLKITVADSSDASNTDDAGLSQLAFDPAGSAGNGKNLVQTVTAQNALLKVDGIDGIAKAANTVTDLIQGVTLNLLKAAPGAPTTLTVARDTGAVKQAVESFVKAYNDLGKTVRDYTGYDAAARRGGLLQGDATANAIVGRVRQILNSPITALGGAWQHLTDIGVSFQSDGTLALDATRLQTAMDSHFDDIAGLFALQGRPSDSLVSYASSTALTRPGSYSVGVTQLATQGVLNGAATAALADTGGTFNAPFAINADNDTLGLKIDGISSGTVSFAQGSYTTAAALTAELQSKINGDSALAAAGVSVAVSFDAAADRLVISSTRYGATSSVEITAVDTTTAATLGWSAAAGTTGTDVAGSINGAAAGGSGRFLTAATGQAAEGLRIEILGGATGDRGTVAFSRGFASRLDDLATELLAAAGPLAARAQGIDQRIGRLDDERTELNQRLVDVEKRLRAQFSALDSLVARLRSTSDFLTRQLATLPGATTQDKR